MSGTRLNLLVQPFILLVNWGTDMNLKKPLTFSEQVEKLNEHGIIIEYAEKKAVEEYSLLEILTALEGSLSPVSDLEKRRGSFGACKTYPVWKELDLMIQEYFREKSLLDLATPELAGNDFVI